MTIEEGGTEGQERAVRIEPMRISCIVFTWQLLCISEMR